MYGVLQLELAIKFGFLQRLLKLGLCCCNGTLCAELESMLEQSITCIHDIEYAGKNALHAFIVVMQSARSG